MLESITDAAAPAAPSAAPPAAPGSTEASLMQQPLLTSLLQVEQLELMFGGELLEEAV